MPSCIAILIPTLEEIKEEGTERQPVSLRLLCEKYAQAVLAVGKWRVRSAARREGQDV